MAHLAQRRLSLLALLAAFFWLNFPRPAAGQEEPFDPEESRPFSGAMFVRNDSPLYLTFFSVAAPDRAQNLPPKRWAVEAGYLDSNTILDQHNVNESDRIIVDGEMQRFEVSLRYGLGRRWELKATCPYLFFGGGYMDSFIESFENSFGFVTPGAREDREAGGVRYLFKVRGEALIDKTGRAIDGLGDIPLQLKFQFRDDPYAKFLPRAAVRAVLKIPTATNPLLGNERFDEGVGLLLEQPLGTRILLLGNLDATTAHLPLHLKTLDVEAFMISSSVGFEHFMTDRASWTWIWTGSTNPYPKFSPDMTSLNSTPMSMAFGYRYRIKPRVTLQMGVAENISSAWPDFSWNTSLRAEF